ncbi:hypothetical protein TNCV_4324141 [Trichonephila clavipes]|nr:hypothetical protein TNCV_4324141 [Trichonephila clavipes]
MQNLDYQQPSEKDIAHPEDISNVPAEKCLENVGVFLRNTLTWCPASYTAWIAFGLWLSERCPDPIDSDKRRSTV